MKTKTTNLLVSMAVVAASPAFPAMLAPSVFAEDPPAGQGASSQQEMKTESTETQPAAQRDTPAATELGTGTERPMRAPESKGAEGATDLGFFAGLPVGPDSNDQIRYLGDE